MVAFQRTPVSAGQSGLCLLLQSQGGVGQVEGHGEIQGAKLMFKDYFEPAGHMALAGWQSSSHPVRHSRPDYR